MKYIYYLFLILLFVHGKTAAEWVVPEPGSQLYSQSGPINYRVKAGEKCTGAVCANARCVNNQLPGRTWVFIRPQYNNKYAAPCVESMPPPPPPPINLTYAQTYNTYNLPDNADQAVTYVQYFQNGAWSPVERHVSPTDGCIKITLPVADRYQAYNTWANSEGLEGPKSTVFAITPGGVLPC